MGRKVGGGDEMRMRSRVRGLLWAHRTGLSIQNAVCRIYIQGRCIKTGVEVKG